MWTLSLKVSVERSGNQVRIRAQLIRASTDIQIWAKTFEGDIREIFTMQSQVTQAIANQIRVRITPQEQSDLHSARPVNPQVLDAYLKGRYFWNKEELRFGLKPLGSLGLPAVFARANSYCRSDTAFARRRTVRFQSDEMFASTPKLVTTVVTTTPKTAPFPLFPK